jgi:hypothetical protein
MRGIRHIRKLNHSEPPTIDAQTLLQALNQDSPAHWRIRGHSKRRAHLKTSRRVVDAGVDDLAVAGTGAGAETGGRLDHDYLAPGHRQRARRREPDDARSHHHGVRRLPRGLRGEASRRGAPRPAGPDKAPQQEHASWPWPLPRRSFVWLRAKAKISVFLSSSIGKFGSIPLKDHHFGSIPLLSHLHVGPHESMTCGVHGIYLKFGSFNGIDPIVPLLGNLDLYHYYLTYMWVHMSQ